MKKLICVLIVLFLVMPSMLLAQEVAGGAVAPQEDRPASLAPVYKEFIIDSFENDTMWHVSISRDVGIATVRHLANSATVKGDPIPLTEEVGAITANPPVDQNGVAIPSDSKVLGIKIEFIKRAWESITVKIDSPIAIIGTVQSVSFLSSGRLYKHNINLLFRSYTGEPIIIPAGQLFHYGWKRFDIKFPNGIDQTDPHYPKRVGGVVFEGFQIDLDPEDISGDYYIYFDDLRVVTNVAKAEYDGVNIVKPGSDDYNDISKILDGVDDLSEIRYDYRNDLDDTW